MHGLVFIVAHRRVVNVRQLVEGKLAIKAQPVITLLDLVALITVSRELLHRFMSGFRSGAVEDSPVAPARDELQSGVSQSQPATMTKARVKVPDLPQLFHNPTIVDELLVAL